jgi:hypothetical protein
MQTTNEKQAALCDDLIRNIRTARKTGVDFNVSAWAAGVGLTRATARYLDAYANGFLDKEFAISSDPRQQHLYEQLRKSTNKYVHEQQRFEALIAACQEMAAQAPALPPYESIAWAAKPTDEEIISCTFADWHYGKIIRREETGGVNEYNTEIAEQRAHRLVDGILKFQARQRRPAKKLCLMNLGDLVHGETIHRGQAWQTEVDLVEQILRGGSIHAHCVSRLSAAFEQVAVLGVPGNHGRFGQKGENKVSSNADILLYEYSKAKCADIKNVQWYISRERLLHVDILGHTVLMHHGDAISGSGGFGGIPVYSMRRMKAGMADALGITARWQIVGHRHSPAIASGTIQASSMCGIDEYAFSNGWVTDDSRVPSQTLCLWNEKYGMFSYSNIYLEPIAPPSAPDVSIDN